MTPSLPLWVLFLILTLTFLLAYEGGFRVGRRRQDRFEGGKRSQAGVIVASLIALTTFFTAFTFSNSYGRFEARKQLVMHEANAIGTAYLRGQLMPEPQQVQILALFKAYVELRLAGAEHYRAGDIDSLKQVITQSENILDKLWQLTTELNQPANTAILNPFVYGLFIEAVNEVIDIHTSRIVVGSGKLPPIIWHTLGVAALLGIMVLGYQAGLSGLRSVFVGLAMVISLAFVFTLIKSLEQPGAVFFAVDQGALQDLHIMMSKQSMQ